MSHLNDAWREADEGSAFWRAHYDELLQSYPEQFVAVSKGGTVVLAAPDLQQAVQQLELRGVPLTSVWIRFVTKDPQTYLL